jgi:hypothetical protein
MAVATSALFVDFIGPFPNVFFGYRVLCLPTHLEISPLAVTATPKNTIHHRPNNST